MKPIDTIKYYYSLFGARGVWLAFQARFQKRCTEIVVGVPGICNPVHLRLRSSDISAFRQVLFQRGYDYPLDTPPRTIVDAGANIGLTSVFYANLYPQAKIIAIEPDEANYRLLQRNTAGYPGIIPVQAGLWKENQELALTDPGFGDWAFQTTALSPSQTEGVKTRRSVPGLTLDYLLEKYGFENVDLLKVDIEGSEKEVFENSTKWIDKIRAIAIELHDGVKPGCSAAFEAATKRFQTVCTRGETVFLIQQGSSSSSQPNRAMIQKETAGAEDLNPVPCKILQVC